MKNKKDRKVQFMLFIHKYTFQLYIYVWIHKVFLRYKPILQLLTLFLS